MKFLITVDPAQATDTALPDLLRSFGWSEGRDWHATLDDQAWHRSDAAEQAHRRALVVEMLRGASVERLIATLGTWLRAQPEDDRGLIVRLPSGQELSISSGDDLEELRRAMPEELVRPPSAPVTPPPPPTSAPGVPDDYVRGDQVHGVGPPGRNYHEGRPPGPPLDPDDDWPRRR